MNNIKSPFKYFCVSVGNLPTAYLESMSYYECITFLVKFLEDQVIPAVNNTSEGLQELQNLYVELKAYVDNYFDNLDVQTEINNKLDDMAEHGELTEIIGAFLDTKALFCYNNIEKLKEADLIAGSYAQTLGYYTQNDGGASKYYISDSELTDDDMFIIGLDNGLHAILLINDVIYPEQVGCKGNDTQDETTRLQTILDKGYNIKCSKNKTYKITSPLRCKANFILDLNNSTINSTDNHLLYNFKTDSTATGYSGNGNLIFKNGTIKGGCISLIHAKNVIFENLNFIDVLTNHNIELCSCRDVLITNCKFNRPYSDETILESVNIDPCLYTSFPWLPSDSVCYDGTANYNIDINSCIFNGGNNYLIKDGVGCHTADINHQKHVNIYNNEFINMSEEGIILATCDNCKIHDNTIISQLYGIAISGDNNMIYNNKIISERDTTTYVIYIRENSTNLSEYNNIVYSNGELQPRHILLPSGRSCTFNKLQFLPIYVSQSSSGGTLTITTNSDINLTDFNKLTLCIGSASEGTYQAIEVKSFVDRKFVLDDGFFISELNTSGTIASEHSIEITTDETINVRQVIASVE